MVDHIANYDKVLQKLGDVDVPRIDVNIWSIKMLGGGDSPPGDEDWDQKLNIF